MHKLSLLFCVALTTFKKALALEVDRGVMILNEQNFDEEVRNYENLLIEFYSPGCSHCKKLEPEYHAAAEELAGMSPPSFLAKVDAIQNPNLFKRYELLGYPTLLFFKTGDPDEKIDYPEHARTKDKIIQWILKETDIPSRSVDCDKLQEILDQTENNKFVLAYFGSKKDPLFAETFLKFAGDEKRQEKMIFVHIEDEMCALSKGVEESPQIVFYRNFETPQNIFDSEKQDVETLSTWIDDKMVKTYFELLVADVTHFLHNPTLVMFRKEEEDKDADFMDEFFESAAQNKYKAKFAYSDIEGDDMQNILKEMMGIKEEDLPTLRAYNPTGNRKYKCDTKPQDMTSAMISQFMEDVLEEKITPIYKTEEVPAYNNDTVKVVVGTTWEEIVMDETKDVFVMYYAPWCKYSKEMQLPWIELSQLMDHNQDMVIAKMDGNANEAPDLFVKHFPTLIYYPKGNKKGITFNDIEVDVTTEVLYNWVTEIEEFDKKK